MTAAGPDPYAETGRLMPGDIFTEQVHEEWVQVVAKALWESIGVPYIGPSRAVVNALLAHLAAQQARPQPDTP